MSIRLGSESENHLPATLPVALCPRCFLTVRNRFTASSLIMISSTPYSTRCRCQDHGMPTFGLDAVAGLNTSTPHCCCATDLSAFKPKMTILAHRGLGLFTVLESLCRPILTRQDSSIGQSIAHKAMVSSCSSNCTPA